MRPGVFEIGVEREYALYAIDGDTVAYLLANDRLLAALDEPAPPGWRIAPEYARCLVEIASPPATSLAPLVAGFADLERRLAAAAARLTAQSRFERIECTPRYSVRTDRFVTWDGTSVTTYADLLLDGAHANWLAGPSGAIPACLGSRPDLLYAGFTSLNATVHPARCDDPADYYWRILHAAHQIDTRTPHRHAFLRDGRFAIAPEPERSIRDALLRWGDPETAALLDALPHVDDPRARFAAITADFHAYSCRPRLVEDTLLFELRCFHSGLEPSRLAPLLAIPAASCGTPPRGV